MALPARYFLHDLITGGTSHNSSRQFMYVCMCVYIYMYVHMCLSIHLLSIYVSQLDSESVFCGKKKKKKILVRQ